MRARPQFRNSTTAKWKAGTFESISPGRETIKSINFPIGEIVIAKRVKKGDTIRVHYTGKLKDGKEFDSSLNREPLQFEVGAGSVIKGFEDAIIGLEQGEKKTVEVPPKKAYGDRDDNLVIEMPQKSVPDEITPEVGMRLQLVNQKGQAVPVMITEVQEESIKLDANHPLAGKTLIFDIELVEII